MTRSYIKSLLAKAEHRAVVMVLHAHPDWTLGQIFDHLLRGPRAAVLRKVTIGELLAGTDQDTLDQRRLDEEDDEAAA